MVQNTSSMLLLLCVVAVGIHFSKSLPTSDSCERSAQVLDELVTSQSELTSAVTQLQHNDQALSELITTRLLTAVYELQAEVAELRTATLPSHATECPDGFSYISSVNGCYKVVRSRRDWAYAGLECRSLHKDAHLLVINSTQEQSAVEKWLKSANQATQSACHFNDNWGLSFWTAGQRIDPSTMSRFVWRLTSTNTYSDTVSVMRYTNWQKGEPNFSHEREACIHLRSPYGYKWNDVSCKYKLCAVCEIDLSQ